MHLITSAPLLLSTSAAFFLRLATRRKAQCNTFRLSRGDDVRQPLDAGHHSDIASHYIRGAARPHSKRRLTHRHTLNYFVQGSVAAVADDDVDVIGNGITSEARCVLGSVCCE